MKIKDIIRSDEDRFFIVDHECYIIFTGETTDDLKPFIRIGNWNDMPVALIPLIENIIITDSLIGDPSHEQFNINVRHLQENRYIGEKRIVSRFLDYQKIFGLDLTNASVVDIKKDLPELSSEKNISHKNQFIGVFYRDGNFKILLDKKAIFDLNGIATHPVSWRNFNDLLSTTYRNSGRFAGSGLIIAGHNPVFHHKKRLYPYLFPDRYFHDFSRLGIDPGKIEAILLPSLNLIRVSKFLKWLHLTGGRVRIFSNSNDLELVRRLYSRSAIDLEKFSGLDFTAKSGLAISNYAGTFNVRLRFDTVEPEGGELIVAFIKGHAGAREIIREKPDLLIIAYTAFEEIALLLKSTDTPFVIVDDGNRNARKLAGGNRIVLGGGCHYEFRRCREFGDILALSGLDGETASLLAGEPESLAGRLEQAPDAASGQDGIPEWCNIISLARAFLSETRDRKLSARIRELIDTPSLEMEGRLKLLDPARHTILLALYNGAVFPFVTRCADGGRMDLFDVIGRDGDGPAETDRALHEACSRIISDRVRLQMLIDIYSESDQYRARNQPGIVALDRALNARKRQYREEALSLDSSWSRSIAVQPGKDGGLPVAPGKETPLSETPHAEAEESRRQGLRLRKSLWIAIPAILLLIAAALLFRFASPSIRDVILRDRPEIVESSEIDARYRPLGKQYNIRIRDHDILQYANRVAVTNGYHRIATTSIKDRNPDWIYPDNVFIMLDGQRVVVSKGDTLWNLSKNKLIESAFAFDGIMKRLDESGIHDRVKIIIEAIAHAHTAEQAGRLRQAVESMSAGEAKRDEERP